MSKPEEAASIVALCRPCSCAVRRPVHEVHAEAEVDDGTDNGRLALVVLPPHLLADVAHRPLGVVLPEVGPVSQPVVVVLLGRRFAVRLFSTRFTVAASVPWKPSTQLGNLWYISLRRPLSACRRV